MQQQYLIISNKTRQRSLPLLQSLGICIVDHDVNAFPNTYAQAIYAGMHIWNWLPSHNLTTSCTMLLPQSSLVTADAVHVLGNMILRSTSCTNLFVLWAFVGQRKGQQGAVFVPIHQLHVDSMVPIWLDEPNPLYDICMKLPAHESARYRCMLLQDIARNTLSAFCITAVLAHLGWLHILDDRSEVGINQQTYRTNTLNGAAQLDGIML